MGKVKSSRNIPILVQVLAQLQTCLINFSQGSVSSSVYWEEINSLSTELLVTEILYAESPVQKLSHSRYTIKGSYYVILKAVLGEVGTHPREGVGMRLWKALQIDMSL